MEVEALRVQASMLAAAFGGSGSLLSLFAALFEALGGSGPMISAVAEGSGWSASMLAAEFEAQQ